MSKKHSSFLSPRNEQKRKNGVVLKNKYVCVCVCGVYVFFVCVRALLCNLVRAKLGCYEDEGQNSHSPEDYLKAFMETEVKPLWPKGWMQARCVYVLLLIPPPPQSL